MYIPFWKLSNINAPVHRTTAIARKQNINIFVKIIITI